MAKSRRTKNNKKQPHILWEREKHERTHHGEVEPEYFDEEETYDGTTEWDDDAYVDGDYAEGDYEGGSYEDAGYDETYEDESAYVEDGYEDAAYDEPAYEEDAYASEDEGYGEQEYDEQEYAQQDYAEPGYEEETYEEDSVEPAYEEAYPPEADYEDGYEQPAEYDDYESSYNATAASVSGKKKKHKKKKRKKGAPSRSRRKQTARDQELNRKKFLYIGIAALTAAAILITVALTVSEYKKRVYTKAVLEAGDHELTPEDFRKNTNQTISFEDEAQVSAIDFHVPGEYPVDLKSGMFHYHATLTVVDTVPPVAEGISLELGFGDTAEATQLVTNVADETALHISFETEPDFEKLGRQPLQIRLMDMGGNYITVDSELVVIPIHPELVREAGTGAPGLNEFLLDSVDSAQASSVQLLTDLSTVDMHTVGTTELEFSMGDYRFTGKLVVEDTVAPELEVEEASERYLNQQIEPEEFVKGYVDATNVTFRFASAPDMTKEGYQDLEIVAEDEAGNSSSAATKLMLVKDTEPPVISGANDLTFYVEDSISYRSGVTLSDNCDKPEDIKLEINTDQVVSGTAGTYKVVYTATDLSGNTAEKTVNLTLISKSYDEATVNALAQQVLAKIITPGMSEYDKVVAIYNWVTGNVRYAEQPNMTDWLKAAYDGLAQHKGDCYVYCMTSKALFDNAGIKNMVIDTVPLRYIHFWNLVDIGEGWHHFDCTPRRAGGVFLYWTDAQIKEYSDAHNNSHIYDRKRFPDIP